MTAIDFALGLAVGLGIYVSQQYRFKQQLKKTLRSYTNSENGEVSLPLNSLIRRELNELDRQRRKIERDKQTWQDLIEQAPIGYLQVDSENRLVACNQTAKDLLRIEPRRSLEVRLLLELVRSYDLDVLIEQTRNSQRCQHKEWIFDFTRYVSPDTSFDLNTVQPLQKVVESIALKGYAFPLSDLEVGVFIENRQPLVELSRSRDRAFSDLTHELRTPLTSISLVAENLLRRLQDPERRWVEQMLRETSRLIELVQEWLDLAQLKDNSNFALKYETLNLNDLIRSVWQILDPIAKKKQVTLSYEGDPHITISGDRARLIQVFLNLLDNAIKHNPPQKEIFVRVLLPAERAQEKQQVEIDIIDSGSGFKATDLPYIFERLYRGDKSRVRQTEERLSPSDGSGLGLAIVEQIVKAHGGKILAKNHPQIGGAWLAIILPTGRLENA